ncbi:hypothetical protein [Bacillus sp. FSL R9-9410]|uniref:hypothetical protein n=1 Tax=Bacillus sp. FSL R9-9410 TaxID=2921590 RepID=UPI0031012DDA
MLSVQLSQYLLKESKPALHTDGKRVYMLNDDVCFNYISLGSKELKLVEQLYVAEGLFVCHTDRK